MPSIPGPADPTRRIPNQFSPLPGSRIAPGETAAQEPLPQHGELIIDKLMERGVTSTAKLEALMKKAAVEDGSLLLQTDKGTVKFSIFAVSDENRFSRIDINPPKEISKINTFEGNPPLMYRFPFVVLKPGTKYGVYLEVPEASFSNVWETFSPAFMYTGERKRILSASLVADGTNPLARKPSDGGTFDEIVFGIRPANERRPDDEPLPVTPQEDRRGLFISKRSTLVPHPNPLLAAIRDASG